MRRIAAVALLLACQPTTMPPPLGDTDGGGTQLTGPAGCAFASNAFALPSMAAVSGAPFDGLTGHVACASSSRSFDYQLLDLTGDGLPDLLVTSACDDANVGTTSWRVYPNQGSAFGAPLSFALPVLSATPGCVASVAADVDGDLKADLVVTSLCTDVSVGTTRWLVYANDGSGFSATATPFALPQGYTNGSFPSLEVDTATCTAGHPAYGFFDATKDGKPDLVVTTACDDVNVGVDHWRVYAGSGTGVGDAVSFPLPGGAVFASPRGGTMSCSATGFSTPTYSVVDFDGDFVPDLVVSQSCSDPGAGTTHWSVYADDGTRFSATPTSVSLPIFSNTPNGAFDSLYGSTPCTTGTASLVHGLADVDGDYKPDLVVLQSCSDASVGVSAWDVYRNGGTSFGNGSAYELPLELGLSASAPATSFGNSLACSGNVGAAAFQAAYLIGAPLDLVVTQSCSDATVGVSRWLTFAASCP